jgi:hypothetical protein
MQATGKVESASLRKKTPTMTQVVLTATVTGIHLHFHGSRTIFCRTCGKPLTVGSLVERKQQGNSSKYYHIACLEATRI